MGRSIGISLAILGLAACGGEPVSDVDPSRVPRLTLDEELTVGGRPEDEFSLDLLSSILPVGDSFVVNRAIGYRHGLFMVGPDGRFAGLRSDLGDGPGEFRSAHPVGTLPGDSLLVISGGELTVLTPGLGYVRQLRVAGSLYKIQGNRFGILLEGRSHSPNPEASVWMLDWDGEFQAVIDTPWEEAPDPALAMTDSRGVRLVGDTVLLVSRDASQMRRVSAETGDMIAEVPVPLSEPGDQTIDLLEMDGRCLLLSHQNHRPLTEVPDSIPFDIGLIRDSKLTMFECDTGLLLGAYWGGEGFFSLVPPDRVMELTRVAATGELLMTLYRVRMPNEAGGVF